MADIPAITKVYLLAVPLESDYKNTLYFTDTASQQAYFQSKIVRTYSYQNFTYQRKDQIIRVPEIYDNIYNCNYVMYQNSNYSNKWFYAFIDKMEYINDGRTDIYINTDVIQTWLFDYTIKPSFVEREHTNNDTIGRNTVPENLETGEYICNGHTTDTSMDTLSTDLCYIIGCTVGLDLNNNKYASVGGGKYNGIYSGVRYYRYDSINDINLRLESLAFTGQSDAITGIFIAPKFLAPLHATLPYAVAPSDDATSHSISKSKTYGLGGYTPRNNKLKTFPFCYMLASNNQGSNAVYRYEDFSDNNCTFIVRGALTPGCSIRIIPTNFKGAGVNDEEAINLGKFPICNYAVDMYTNWLTQNSVNIGASFLSSGLSIGAGVGELIATGGLVGYGEILGGVSSIASTLGTLHEQSLVPPQARGNLNNGDVITSTSKNNFHFYNMSIKNEYAQIIDGYFDMFGYKTNKVKIPNTAHRSRWWYTKTIDINIDGNIPNDDMQKIKDCYNKGITFWRNASEIQNYSLSNNIV